MSRNIRMVPVLAFVAATLLPALSLAQADHSDCLLQQQRITTVLPYRTGEHLGKAAVQQIRGARVFVQAAPGVTAEWLQLEFRRHLTAMKAADMPDCVFDVDSVRVDVTSGGDGFWVTLRAGTQKDGQEVLRRARLLVG